MFVSKKEFENLQKEIKELKEIVSHLTQRSFYLEQEINELKKPSEPNYFG
jgi:prefoldin subunit 5